MVLVPLISKIASNNDANKRERKCGDSGAPDATKKYDDTKTSRVTSRSKKPSHFSPALPPPFLRTNNIPCPQSHIFTANMPSARKVARRLVPRIRQPAILPFKLWLHKYGFLVDEIFQNVLDRLPAQAGTGQDITWCVLDLRDNLAKMCYMTSATRFRRYSPII